MGVHSSSSFFFFFDEGKERMCDGSVELHAGWARSKDTGKVRATCLSLHPYSCVASKCK